MNAIEAVNHYAQRGDRVDELLQHVVVSEVERLQTLLEGNDGMSVREIKAQFMHLHRQKMAVKRENEKLREALEEISTLRNHVYPTEYVLRVESLARQALRGESDGSL